MRMSVLSALQQQKRELRKATASTLRTLSKADVDNQSRKITECIKQAPWFSRSNSVCCYLSMPSGEVHTNALVSLILDLDKDLYVPRVEPLQDGHMDFLKLYGEADLGTLPAGRWGIREPGLVFGQGETETNRANALDSDSAPLDIIFVPGVAFDRKLSRLGHGKGYYDRFFTNYTNARGSARPLLVALALREQIVDEVPTAPHDWTVNMIVTADEVLTRPEPNASLDEIIQNT